MESPPSLLSSILHLSQIQLCIGDFRGEEGDDIPITLCVLFSLFVGTTELIPQQAVSTLEILLAFPSLGTRSLSAEVSLKLAMGKLPNLWMTDAWHTRDGCF